MADRYAAASTAHTGRHRAHILDDLDNLLAEDRSTVHTTQPGAARSARYTRAR